MAVEVSNLLELQKIQAFLHKGFWLFRGHADADWILESSLERFFGQRIKTAQVSPICGEVLEQAMAEKSMLRDFKKEAHNYEHVCPQDDDVFGWFAMMQHFGCPTRVLDITRSFYVALFFALENASSETDKSSSVWAFRDPVAYNTFSDVYDHPKAKGAPGALAALNRIMLENDAPKMVMAAEPYRRNIRASCQQGWFLVPVSGRETLRTQLCKCYGMSDDTLEKQGIERLEKSSISDVSRSLDEVRLLKINIPSTMRIEVLDHLRRCNVHSHMLFPGLDGLARSLKFRCEEWQRYGISHGDVP